jgi:hypothetical protein
MICYPLIAILDLGKGLSRWPPMLTHDSNDSVWWMNYGEIDKIFDQAVRAVISSK